MSSAPHHSGRLFDFMSTIKRRFLFIGGLAVVISFVAYPFVQHAVNRTVRFVSGQHFLGGGPLPGRSRESLPSIAGESGGTLRCRMLYCDFRFPLPRGTQLARADSVAGSFDTIKGTIYVTNTDGGEVNLHAYARVLRKDGFSVHDDAGLDLSASSPDGGFVAADTSGADCKITFSFFGDY